MMLGILSWNIQYGKGVDGRIDLARLRDHVVALGDPDVVCLQEVSAGFADVDGGADQFAALAALFPDHRLYAPPAIDWLDDGRERRFGNALLSRLPWIERLSHPLPRPADPSTCHMQRHLIEAVVATPLGPLRIGTTHLEYYSLHQRRAQALRLRELAGQWADAVAAPPKARDSAGVFAARPAPIGTVLCGDFNFPPDEHTYEAIQQPIGAETLVDPWTLVGGGAPHAPTCGVFDRQQWRIGPHARDFFFVSRGLADHVRSLRTDLTTDLSDHQPVLLTLSPPGASPSSA